MPFHWTVAGRATISSESERGILRRVERVPSESALVRPFLAAYSDKHPCLIGKLKAHDDESYAARRPAHLLLL